MIRPGIFRCLHFHVNQASYFKRCYANIKSAFAMDTAYFRHVHGENEFHVTFRFKNGDLGIDKQFNFCRKLDETCADFLNRVNGNLLKILEKKSKKKKAMLLNRELTQTVPIVRSSLTCNGEPLPDEMKCEEFFLTPNYYVMNLLDSQWKIAVNAPWIEIISLPKVIMVDFPVFHSKFVAFFVHQNASLWTWSRSTSKGGPWKECGQGLSYVPNVSDIGYYLRVVCHPRSIDGREGPPVESISPATVDAGPGFLPFEIRHQFTRDKVDDSGFRIVSYNILADLYVDSEFSKTQLFGYCPTYALDLAYRKQLLLKELLGYNADILCLQEVDSKVFRHDLEPILGSVEMSGEYSQKGGTVSEGTTILFSSKKFKSLKSWRVVLGEVLSSEPLFADIWEKIRGNEAYVARVTQRSTTLQVMLLENLTKPGRLLLVANTHLYFHPDADHVRLLQGVLITIYLQALLKDVMLDYPDHRTSLILCGDFNSTPERGIYRLLTTGSVESDNLDWRSNVIEAVRHLSYAHHLKIASACGTPDYTNYTPGFKACIDYIFYQTDYLQVKQVVPLPSEEDLRAHGGIPSVVFPSDHIALVSDIHWESQMG